MRLKSRFFVLVLSAAMVVAYSVPSFAVSTSERPNSGDGSVIQTLPELVSLGEGNAFELGENQKQYETCIDNLDITITVDDAIMDVEVVDIETGEEAFFQRDDEAGTIYSSVTGETIPVDELIELDSCYSSINGVRKASASYPMYKQYKISYASLQKIVGVGGGSAASIAGAIITILSYKEKITAGTALVLGLITNGVGLATVVAGIKTGSSSHGLTVNLKRKTCTKWQGGHKITYYKYTPYSIGTY